MAINWNKLRICWIVLLMLLFHRLSAQPTFHAELFGGPSISYLSMIVNPENFYFKPLNKVSYTLGLNLSDNENLGLCSTSPIEI